MRSVAASDAKTSDLCSMKAPGYAALVTRDLEFIAQIMQLSLHYYLQNTPYQETLATMAKPTANRTKTYLQELEQFLLSPENKDIHPLILSHTGSEQIYAILMGLLLKVKSSSDSGEST